MPIWKAPTWVQSFYANFPLRVLDQDDTLDSDNISSPILWISPPESTLRPWASSDPECLRAQLLMLLRGVPGSFRPWANASAAPGGLLPALHLPKEGKLLPSGEIRQWLDARSTTDERQGMPDQNTFDKAVALAQLINGRIRPAHASGGRSVHLDIPVPPVLSAGLTTPLPASLTGDARDVDMDLLQQRADEAWDAVEVAVENGWALGTSQPTPLDALVAAYVFTSWSSLTRRPSLLEYADRVLDRAEGQL